MREHEYVCERMGHRKVERTVATKIGHAPVAPPCPTCGWTMKKVYHAVPMFTNWKRGR